MLNHETKPDEILEISTPGFRVGGLRFIKLRKVVGGGVFKKFHS